MSVAKAKTTAPATRRKTKKSEVKLGAAKRAAKRRAAKAVFPTVIKLSARDSKRLLADLASPPKPNKRLKKAAARYKRLMAKKKR
ncbi:MAG: DUF1778 domain-containing protein [Chloracidobacterium sp.]|nr:DUF1778 domain-containing protein [Chloracidobacterium sp.]